jgi:hypothetical protein
MSAVIVSEQVCFLSAWAVIVSGQIGLRSAWAAVVLGQFLCLGSWRWAANHSNDWQPQRSLLTDCREYKRTVQAGCQCPTLLIKSPPFLLSYKHQKITKYTLEDWQNPTPVVIPCGWNAKGSGATRKWMLEGSIRHMEIAFKGVKLVEAVFMLAKVWNHYFTFLLLNDRKPASKYILCRLSTLEKRFLWRNTRNSSCSKIYCVPA